jgi:hypothetical protein
VGAGLAALLADPARAVQRGIPARSHNLSLCFGAWGEYMMAIDRMEGVMGSIELPRPAGEAPRPAPQDRLPAEPATGRALWPTFMRRTLDEHLVRIGPAEPPRAA